MDIAEIVKELRSKLYITQDALASQMRVKRETLCKIESGERDLKLSELGLLARAFNMSVQDLISYPKKCLLVDDGAEFKKAETKVILQMEIKGEPKEELIKRVFSGNGIEI